MAARGQGLAHALSETGRMQDPDANKPEARGPVNASALLIVVVAILVVAALIIFAQRETLLHPNATTTAPAGPAASATP